MDGTGDAGVPRVLHVVVGHGLPGYFLNAVRAIRAVAPGDTVLIVDNASPQPELRDALAKFAGNDGNCELIVRTENDLRTNRKVGSLYDAYEIAFGWAIGRGFGLLHLLQGDFQTLWWDDSVAAKAMEVYAARPACVNLQLQFLSRDRQVTEDLAPAGGGLVKLRNYGLTDTGLYHLGRWRERAMRFADAEQTHARHYLAAGYEVIRHPWPVDAPIPWPAVVRGGAQRGREVDGAKPFLLRPLAPDAIARLRAHPGETWLEDVCVPWGWACLTPMWVSDVDSIEYWVLRYRNARRDGLRHLLPRLEQRGVDRAGRRLLTGTYRYRPSLFRLFIAAPAGEAARRLTHRK